MSHEREEGIVVMVGGGGGVGGRGLPGEGLVEICSQTHQGES